MKKTLTTTIALAALAVAWAAEAPAKKNETPEEKAAKRAEMQKRFYERTGGYVERPNAAKGKIAFIDTQEECSERIVRGVAGVVENIVKFRAEYSKAKPGEPGELLKKSGADLAVIAVADDKTPAMLVAPEDRWAVVNVRKLGEFKDTPEDLKRRGERTSKELLRAFSALCGGTSSMYAGNMFSCAKLEQLDAVKSFFPMDMLDKYRRYLEQLGVTQRQVMTYRMACRQGWAPAPTNDVQKAVAEAVKNEPKKPAKRPKAKQ